MKTYLVGGAVRDYLLDKAPTERDWVVIGSTPEEMLKLGFRPVGKDFPVFLHPETQEEYALARTERKTGRGYTQFNFHASPEVTLEEDLRRRDLTINAMAMTENGGIIDPYGGQTDIAARILRHVSPAFIEDPVRILRIARLMARFSPLGFIIAPDTYALMTQMVKNGEVDALVPDRVWAECQRALSEPAPLIFFEVLQHCSALEKLFPELAALTLTPNPSPLTPFRERGVESILTFAALTLSLTPSDIKALCQRYPIPAAYRELALMAHQTQESFKQRILSPEALLNLLEKTDAYRREKRFQQLLILFKDSPVITPIQKAFIYTQKIPIDSFMQAGYTGKALGEKLRQKRLEIISDL